MTVSRKLLRAPALLAACLPILLAETPPTITITEFPAWSDRRPDAIAAGPDGALWYTDMQAIGRMTTAGVLGIEYGVADAAETTDITTGPDGAMWFPFAVPPTQHWQWYIGRITMAGKVTTFPLPADYWSVPSITTGTDGALWFAMAKYDLPYYSWGIGRMSTAGSLTEYWLGTADGSKNQGGGVVTITYGPDGALWFGEYYGDNGVQPPHWVLHIGRITNAGVVTRYELPADWGYDIGAIAPGSDGALWFTGKDAIGRMTTAGTFSQFPAPNVRASITPGPDGALWFTESDGIDRITTSGAITTYPQEFGTRQIGKITAGPDGALWLPIWSPAAILRIVLSPKPFRANRAQQTPPIRLGASGSNGNDTGAVCCAGTLGALVTKGRAAKYILSNNHVLARTNLGQSQDPIIHRGYIDTAPRCSATGTVTVAALYQWVPLNFLAGTNTVDAAIAQVNPAMVNPQGAILGIGTVSPATAVPAVEMLVEKSGRTTGTTTGSINAIHVTAKVGYEPCGGGTTQVAKFVNQFSVIPHVTFSQAGDSGSLILAVAPGARPNPVGLLFAGSPSGKVLGNPINAVLTAFGIQFVGTASAAEKANAMARPEEPQMLAAARIKDRYDDSLLALPEVVGHGIGYARDGSHRPVIQLYLRQATAAARQAAPATLQGVPVEIHETGEFRAIPACGP